ncbi:MAG: LpqB family beta-propeller domain-containing protein [Microbacteriaceae bacterium]|nr:LpqB family beta-propeller domain-containing protein [Microbacteriaceae bacterium]
MKKLSLLMVVLLTGCAQLPSSGPVSSGPVVEVGGGEDFAFYTPSGPELSADQTEIVSGFINAHIGPQNDYAIAREFLTEEFSAAWNPQEEVLIRSSSPRYEPVSDNRQQVTVRTIATVDEVGEYRSLEEIEQRTLFFNLVQEEGEWRIDSAPDLTVVSSPVFSVVFQSYSIYFYDRGYRYLVPDVRWFPVRSSSATRMVRALLDGPSEWMEDSVRTAIPEQTSLTIDSVPINDAVAEVDLSSQALTADSSMRSLMKAQIQNTLTSLSTVSSIEILIDRNPQEIELVSPTQLPNSPGAPLMLSETSVYRINGSTAIPVAGSSTHVLRLNPTEAALSESEQTLALVNEQGMHLAELESNESVLIDEQPDIISPHFDADDYLWSVSASNGINVYKKGQLTTLVESQSDTRVDFALSPEGSRMVEIVEVDEVRRLQIRGVIRDSEGKPRALTDPVTIRSARPQLVSWIAESELALVEKTVSDSTVLSVSSLLGETEDAITPPITIEGLTTVGSSVYVLSPLGEVWSRFGNTWRVLVNNGLSINTAG